MFALGNACCFYALSVTSLVVFESIVIMYKLMFNCYEGAQVIDLIKKQRYNQKPGKYALKE
jgi:hypothetical protein